MRFKRPVNTAVKHLWLSWIAAQWRQYSPYGPLMICSRTHWSRIMHIYACFGKISALCQVLHHLQPCLFVFNKTQIAPHVFAELLNTRRGADKFWARPTSGCRRTESIVSLERGRLFMCRIASLFLLQRLKGSMSGDGRVFINMDTRAVIIFFYKARRRRKYTPFWQKH